MKRAQRKLSRNESLAIKQTLLRRGSTHEREAAKIPYSRPHFTTVLNGKAPATDRFINYMESLGIDKSRS